MKLLLDSCIWGPAASELRAAGHDVVWVGEWLADPGDEAILAAAAADGRILVTLDKDFGTIAVAGGHDHAGIIRLVEISARRHAASCLSLLDVYREALEAGAIVTASPARTRVRLRE